MGQTQVHSQESRASRGETAALLKNLARSTDEKMVENAWWIAISRGLSMTIESSLDTDGYGEIEDVRLLMEFKFDKSLLVARGLAAALGQSVFYCKRFEEEGRPLPNVLLLGDRDECVVVPSDDVLDLLKEDYEWSRSPSTGDARLREELEQRYESGSLKCLLFDLSDGFRLDDLVSGIQAVSRGESPKVEVTPENLATVFRRWEKQVFKRLIDHDASTSEIADIFLRTISAPHDPAEAVRHPRKSLLEYDIDGETRRVSVREAGLSQFLVQFATVEDPAMVVALWANKDQILEERERRMQGAFFTPRVWASEAQRLLDRTLGDGWREDCLVWDPACGTGNLTRDFVFNDLLLSTLEESDAQAAAEHKHHRGADCFAYDFINDTDTEQALLFDRSDDLPDRVVARLQQAASEGKRLVFILNPPFGTAGNMNKSGKKKTGIARSAVNLAMREAGLKKPSQQLYAQFMYRIASVVEAYGFERSTVALFSKPNFMTGGSYDAFRRFWYGRFAFQGGFLFQASHFNKVKGSWGVSLTLWSEGTTDCSTPRELGLLETDASEVRIQKLGVKALYQAEGRRASDWARGAKTRYPSDGIQLKSGLQVNETGMGKGLDGHLGWLNNDGNDVYHSPTTVWLQSAGKSSTHNNGGWFLTPENVERSLMLFAARKSVKGDWIRDKDEYLAPCPEVTSTAEFGAWSTDALVYAAAHFSNTCCGGRSLQYKGVSFDVSNHLFWHSADEIVEMADFDKLTADAEAAKGKVPQLVSSLAGKELGEEAGRVMEGLKQMSARSMSAREDYYYEDTELQSYCWDAGLHQLKHLFADACPERWARFKKDREALRVRVREGVYKFGFLL